MPTLVHITHIKAGSTWFHQMLGALFGRRVMPRFGEQLFRGGQTPPPIAAGTELSYLELFKAMPYRPGYVYPAMFITRNEFQARPEFADARRFVVIRDLRDTITSHYFSLKRVHGLDSLGRVKAAREYLQASSKDDGFRFLFDRDLDRLMQIQESWLDAGEIVLRYEELIRDDVALLTRLFVETLQLPVNSRAVDRAVVASRFQTVYKRKLGQLDETSHARQGLPGDWKNHFSPAIRAEFERRAGAVLIKAGYENDSSWVERR